MKAQHISLDVVRAGNIASISRNIRTLAWCLWVDLTGQGHHHGDHSIKSTWYCGHKPMNYNASPIMSFVMLCVPSSCCSVGYWREVLRFLTFRHFASVQNFVRDLSYDQRFARAHNMRDEVWWLYLWEVPWFYLPTFQVSASRSRQEMRLAGASAIEATRAGSECGNIRTLEYQGFF